MWKSLISLGHVKRQKKQLIIFDVTVIVYRHVGRNCHVVDSFRNWAIRRIISWRVQQGSYLVLPDDEDNLQHDMYIQIIMQHRAQWLWVNLGLHTSCVTRQLLKPQVKREKNRTDQNIPYSIFSFFLMFSSVIHICMFLNYKYMVSLLKSPWSNRQRVGLLDEKPRLESQARHQNELRKVFLRRFSLSSFLAKTLRVNKITVKSFSKNLYFGVDFKLQVPPLIYKINTHNISGVRNQVNNPD